MLIQKAGEGVLTPAIGDQVKQFLQDYKSRAPEIHLGKDIVHWLAATNLFVAKMGFLPIGAELGAQLSVLARAPVGTWENGYRVENADATDDREGCPFLSLPRLSGIRTEIPEC